jgi:hypothetical protein
MILERLARNGTRATVACLPVVDGNGRDAVVAVAKIAYEIDAAGRARLADEEASIPVRPESKGDDAPAPRRDADLWDYKPGTDVVLVGTARPPDRDTRVMDVSIRVQPHGREPLAKTIRVHGPRVWRHGLLGVEPAPAAPLEPTPLAWELAFGGVDPLDPTAVDPRNPVGRGFTRHRERLVGALAPQLEDPAAPLTSSRPAPAAFAPIAPHWSPRAELAGTYDEVWRRERAPCRPVDFDRRHACSAQPELHADVPLLGDEPIEIVGATPRGRWIFQAPRYSPRFVALVGGEEVPLATHLDTLWIDTDARRVEMTWRACIALPRKSERLVAVCVTHERDLPSEVAPEPLVAPARAPGGVLLPR